MGHTWTPEQKQVIQTRGKNILVSAAAGSGKTAVLVERIIEKITDSEHPMDIDRLLVVTFTKAAAAEMRERVSAAIEKKRQEQPENLNLIRQASLIHNAMITTIDSFCLFVVRNHFGEINLDPNFRIADEGEIRLLKEDVLQAVFEAEYAKPKEENADFFDLVDTYSGKRNDRSVKDMVAKLYDLSASSPWQRQWLLGLTKNYEAETMEELFATPIFSEIATHCRQVLESLYERAQRLYDIALQPDGPQKYEAMLKSDMGLLEAAKGQADYQGLYEVFANAEFTRAQVIRSFDGDTKKKEAVADGRKAIKEEFDKLKSNYFSKPVADILTQTKQIRPYVLELVRLAIAFMDAMDAKKRSMRIMDFSDIEHFALQILVDEKTKQSRPTAEEFRRHFDEIMIDEYQDSNQVQEAILSAISGNEDGVYNMFMVGDVKQSIYRFRLACPELFMEKYKTYEPENEAHKRIELHKNFRSRSEVLDFSNDIFYKIMQEDLGEVIYDEAAALYCGADFQKESGFAPEVLLLDESDPMFAEQTGETGAEDADKKQLEARMIGSRIKKLMEETQITDKETGLPRAMRFSDIVILFRSLKDWGNVFADVLSSMGIPAHVESATGYFSTIEVQTVLNMLRILDNPLQDIPMAAVLKSPMAGLSDEELAEIAAGHKELPFAAAALEEMKQAEEGSLYDFYRTYTALRRKTGELPIHELIVQILSDTGYLDYASLLPAGEKRAANLKMLVEKAIAYEQTSYKGLFHFIRYINLLEKYEIDFGEADVTGENADVVHIMTIHKSKGLEFPVVFVSGLAKRFNMSDSKDKMVVHADLGLGLVEMRQKPKRRIQSLLRTEIAEYLKREALGEELRVLYVALTRAKEKLILTGTVKHEEDVYTKYTGNVLPKVPLAYLDRVKAVCYLDWILPALLSYPDKYAVTFCNPGEMVWESVEDMGQKNLDYETLMQQIRQAPDARVAALRDAFSYEYPYAADADRKIKYSVSELKHISMVQKYDEEASEAERPDFLLEEKEPYIPDFAKKKDDSAEPEERVYGVSRGALRGTAVHRVMECLDFAGILAVDTADDVAVKAFVKNELERMKKTDELPDEMRRLVNPALIEGFVKSSVALRMARADKDGVLFREKPFVMQHLGVLVQGIVDVFWMEDGDIVLLDYKTDRVSEASELVLRYQTQLALYADALTRIFSDEKQQTKAKESLIYAFALQEVVKV